MIANLSLAITALCVAAATAQDKAGTLTFLPLTVSPEVQGLMRFQNIDMHTIRLKGEVFIGRSVKIRVRRFDKGKLTLDKVAIDTSELGKMGQMAAGELDFRVFSNVTGKKARIDFQFDRFASSMTYPCRDSRYDYVMKNFLGGRESQPVQVGKETAFLALLLPTEHADGSASYCEVAQSGIEPVTLGAKFNIPSYFLISITVS